MFSYEVWVKSAHNKMKVFRTALQTARDKQKRQEFPTPCRVLVRTTDPMYLIKLHNYRIKHAVYMRKYFQITLVENIENAPNVGGYNVVHADYEF